MNPSGNRKIPSVRGANNEPLASVQAPDRPELEQHKRPLKIGAPNKADLWLFDRGDGAMVVKDFAHKGWLVRQVGRLQIGHEFRAYRWLGSMRGIPGLIGRVDKYSLALEFVDGIQLGLAEDLQRHRHAFPRIRAILERMHATGLVHWDLRTRDNVLLTDSGEVYVVDFASALWLRPGGMAHRVLFGWMALIDRSALLKWHSLLKVGPLNEEQQAFLRRYEFWRSLWPFNRKRRKMREP